MPGNGPLVGKGRAPDKRLGICCRARSWRAQQIDAGGSLRQIASGGDRTVPQRLDQRPERGQDSLVALAKERGEDVFADLVPPEVVATVAARHAGSVEVDPVCVRAPGYVVAAGAGARSSELEAALQSVQVDPDGVEIDGGYRRTQI